MTAGENRQAWLQELAQLSKEKMIHLGECLRITKEMDQCLRRNDRDSIELLLVERGEEIDALDDVRSAIFALQERYEGNIRQEIAELDRGESRGQKEPEATQCLKFAHASQSAIRQLKEVDKAMNRRLGGKDSFYGEEA